MKLIREHKAEYFGGILKKDAEKNFVMASVCLEVPDRRRRPHLWFRRIGYTITNMNFRLEVLNSLGLKDDKSMNKLFLSKYKLFKRLYDGHQ